MVKRIYLEALVIGACLGMCALALDSLPGAWPWPAQVAAYMICGGLLCLIQYGLGLVSTKARSGK